MVESFQVLRFCFSRLAIQYLAPAKWSLVFTLHMHPQLPNLTWKCHLWCLHTQLGCTSGSRSTSWSILSLWLGMIMTSAIRMFALQWLTTYRPCLNRMGSLVSTSSIKPSLTNLAYQDQLFFPQTDCAHLLMLVQTKISSCISLGSSSIRAPLGVRAYPRIVRNRVSVCVCVWPLQTRMGYMCYILFLHFMLQKLSKMM